MLKGAALLDASRRAVLLDRCVATLRATARIEDGGVNWPSTLQVARPGASPFLMQWCHGAPGIVSALSDFPVGHSPEIERLLLGAGHAIWSAGPLAKGYGLCHGTAGNGYAFLALHARTGDPLWLERARAFAIHALGQQARMRAQHGRGRYALWTGDPGLAVFLWHCIRGQGGLPGLGVLL